MRFSPFLPQKDDVANQVMMCHRVSRFRVKHEKTTGFQGKMDFRNTPIGDAIFFDFFTKFVATPFDILHDHGSQWKVILDYYIEIFPR